MACSTTNNRIDPFTYTFYSDCSSKEYCNNGQCSPRTCRTDSYPAGYSLTDELPPRCPNGTFCPDEGDRCIALLETGMPCQLMRDNQCISHKCLNATCIAIVQLNSPCVIENTAYYAYSQGNESRYIVSRDNCGLDTYCDVNSRICVSKHLIGQECLAHKECISDYCHLNTCKNWHSVDGSFLAIILGIFTLCLVIGIERIIWNYDRRRRNAKCG